MLGHKSRRVINAKLLIARTGSLARVHPIRMPSESFQAAQRGNLSVQRVLTNLSWLTVAAFLALGYFWGRAAAYQSPPRNSFGSITGLIKYPDESLPPMRVYAISLDGAPHYRTITRANDTRFTIRNVPAGRYFVVAYTDEAPGLAGGWSKAVPCGLSVRCKDHSLIAVMVAASGTATGIIVADWYAAAGAFPSEPSSFKPVVKADSVRAVDFRNFTYTTEAGSLVLRNGREEGAEGGRLLAVKYLDFDRDGNEEALITIAFGRRAEGAYSEEYFVYAQSNGSLRQVFRQSREKPQRMRINGLSIILTAPFWKTDDPGCCPSVIETAAYRWRGGGFVRISRQLRPIRY